MPKYSQPWILKVGTGRYQWTLNLESTLLAMLLGLYDTHSTFQTLMSQIVLLGYINQFFIVCLHDIIIYSQNWTDYLLRISLVLERLGINGLTCALEKSFFERTEVQYLGHVVTRKYNRAQDTHIQAVFQAEVPASKKALQKFLGICG